jgi:2-C-methyl-D-erythritol 2,4-cyclodiphosphate synthase
LKIRVGQGFDAHRLVAGRPLFIGGVEIPHDRGLEGHSDGDVLLHAIADALLGALGKGDLGSRFPSSDPTLAGIASSELLARVAADMRADGMQLRHLDATVIAERPRLASHQAAMREGVAALLGADAGEVNIKVTSTDGLGAIGRGEGIAAQAVLLLVATEAQGA